MAAFERERLVTLVGDDPQLALDGQAGHRLQRGEREDGARRIVGAVDHDQLRPLGDGRSQPRGVEVEASGLERLHLDRHAAHQPRLLGIRDPVRAGHQHLVAGIEEGDDEVEERVLGADGDEDVGRLVGEAVVALELGADGRPQLGDAADLGVLRLPAPHGFDGGVLDALRGVEVRLAGAERDHVDALGTQLLGLGLHGQGRGRGKRLQPIGQHVSLLVRPGSGRLQRGGNFSLSRFSTMGGTMPATEVPKLATSLMSRDEMYV